VVLVLEELWLESEGSPPSIRISVPRVETLLKSNCFEEEITSSVDSILSVSRIETVKPITNSSAGDKEGIEYHGILPSIV